MLKGIPPALSPGLLKTLMEMGHGDEIVLADANFPVESVGANAVVVRADGVSGPEMLDAVLSLMPLDPYSENQLALMELAPPDRMTPEIWTAYREIAQKYEPENSRIQWMERFAFYERAKKAYAIVATGETAVYANILLKKGVVAL